MGPENLGTETWGEGQRPNQIFITSREGPVRLSNPPHVLLEIPQAIDRALPAEKIMYTPIPAGMSIAKTVAVDGNLRAAGNGPRPNPPVWVKMERTSIGRAKPAKILPVHLQAATIPVPEAVAVGDIPAPAGEVALMAVPVAGGVEAVVAAEADAAKRNYSNGIDSR